MLLESVTIIESGYISFLRCIQQQDWWADFYLKHHIEQNMTKHKSCHWVLSQLYCLQIIPYSSVLAVKIMDVLLILLIFFFGGVFVWIFKIHCLIVFMAKDDVWNINCIILSYFCLPRWWQGKRWCSPLEHLTLHASLSLNGEITLVIMKIVCLAYYKNLYWKNNLISYHLYLGKCIS